MGHRPSYEHRPVQVDKTLDCRARELIAQQSIDSIAKRIADSTRNIDPKQLVIVETADILGTFSRPWYENFGMRRFRSD
jgi:hypothetical protein